MQIVTNDENSAIALLNSLLLHKKFKEAKDQTYYCIDVLKNIYVRLSQTQREFFQLHYLIQLCQLRFASAFCDFILNKNSDCKIGISEAVTLHLRRESLLLSCILLLEQSQYKEALRVVCDLTTFEFSTVQPPQKELYMCLLLLIKLNLNDTDFELAQIIIELYQGASNTMKKLMIISLIRFETQCEEKLMDKPKLYCDQINKFSFELEAESADIGVQAALYNEYYNLGGKRTDYERLKSYREVFLEFAGIQPSIPTFDEMFSYELRREVTDKLRENYVVDNKITKMKKLVLASKYIKYHREQMKQIPYICINPLDLKQLFSFTILEKGQIKQHSSPQFFKDVNFSLIHRKNELGLFSSAQNEEQKLTFVAEYGQSAFLQYVSDEKKSMIIDANEQPVPKSCYNDVFRYKITPQPDQPDSFQQLSRAASVIPTDVDISQQGVSQLLETNVKSPKFMKQVPAHYFPRINSQLIDKHEFEKLQNTQSDIQRLNELRKQRQIASQFDSSSIKPINKIQKGFVDEPDNVEKRSASVQQVQNQIIFDISQHETILTKDKRDYELKMGRVSQSVKSQLEKKPKVEIPTTVKRAMSTTTAVSAVRSGMRAIEDISRQRLGVFEKALLGIRSKTERIQQRPGMRNDQRQGIRPWKMPKSTENQRFVRIGRKSILMNFQ